MKIMIKRMLNSVLISAIIMLNLTGCQQVKPWHRGDLARSEMQFNHDLMANTLDSHIYFSKEGSSGNAGLGGGGCGCN